MFYLNIAETLQKDTVLPCPAQSISIAHIYTLISATEVLTDVCEIELKFQPQMYVR